MATKLQKQAATRRLGVLRKYRVEASLREPDSKGEIMSGGWDHSPLMRQVIKDFEVVGRTKP